MIHYSVLIPERDAADAVGRLLPQLCRVLDGLTLPYEIICIDDASAPQAAGRLEQLLGEYAPLRVLRFDEPRGTSAALSAALAAARGNLVIAMDPQAARSIRCIPHLIARLSQHDLVVARHERPPLDEVWQSAARVARLLAARRDVRRGEDLFWAARRDAVCGLALSRGAFRILDRIVAARGFRVCQLLLAEGLPPAGKPYQAGVVDRLAGYWSRRRFEPHLASEMMRADEPRPRMVPARYDAARPRYVPQPVFTPLEKQSGDAP
jgi:glycosyltransferase involved in cell wall biosynthesis